MITVLIVLGILVGFTMAAIIPWLLLRKLEDEDEANEDG